MGRLQMNVMIPTVDQGILKALDASSNNLEIVVDNFNHGHYDHCSNADGCKGHLSSSEAAGGEEDWDADGHSPEDDPDHSVLFWESQESLLQEVLERNRSSSLKLRQEVWRIIGVAKHTDFCSCVNPDAIASQEGCTNCLRHKVVDMLSQKRFDAAICTSQWKNTRDFPGGKHEYIELIASTSTKRKKIPYLVELEFKDQFEIAKPCEQYRRMVSQLPEYYVGKADCLNAIVRILCESAKRSMKEQKIHMGPWRKKSFMQMKWSISSPKPQLQEDSLSGKRLPLPTSAVEII